MDPELRFESKYLIAYDLYYRVRADVRSMCSLDDIVKTIVKIDILSVRCILTMISIPLIFKTTGENKRNKLRIRSYSANKLPGMPLMIEQKRIGRLIHKHKTSDS